MKDLIAIATVRRLLLEMGCLALPDEPEPRLGPLSHWVARPQPGLEGLTPQQVLGQPDGESRLRSCLSAILAPPPSA